VRSADRVLPRVLAPALLAALVLPGCAAVRERLQSPARDEAPAGIAAPAPAPAVTPVAAPPAPPAASPLPGPAAAPAAAAQSPRIAQPAAPAGTAAAAGQPVVAGPPPIDPAVRRSFDDARLAMLTGHPEVAEKAFAALAQAHPEYAGPQANLGILDRQAGRLSQSAGHLEAALRLGGEQPPVLNELAITYRMQGNFAGARAAWEKALAADSSYAPAVLNLAILHDLYLWEAPRAIELYERYLALVPEGDEHVAKWLADLRNRERAARKKEEGR